MGNNIQVIEKIIKVVNKKHLSLMFDEPVIFSIGDVNVVHNKHYVVTINLNERYFQEEPYSSNMGKWWHTLLKVNNVYKTIYPDGSLNFQPKKISN